MQVKSVESRCNVMRTSQGYELSYCPKWQTDFQHLKNITCNWSFCLVYWLAWIIYAKADALMAVKEVLVHVSKRFLIMWDITADRHQMLTSNTSEKLKDSLAMNSLLKKAAYAELCS